MLLEKLEGKKAQNYKEREVDNLTSLIYSTDDTADPSHLELPEYELNQVMESYRYDI
jgi:hypothetical protein